MQNVKQIWKETATKLQKLYERREAENISYLLLEDLFGVEKVSVLAGDEASIPHQELDDAIKRLMTGEPLQYVTGIADFYGRKFHVRKGSLVPRPETEELCDLIIRENEVIHPKILDIGVGSGCIAITLAMETKGEVIGTDVSAEALAVAEKNAGQLSTTTRFVQNDVLTEVLPADQLDILVSNPPYIPAKEAEKMNQNVLGFEPELALFVPDNDPLLFYREIAKKGKQALKAGGKIYFEIHEDFGNEIAELLDRLAYQEVKVFQDMQGKDRMVSGVR